MYISVLLLKMVFSRRPVVLSEAEEIKLSGILMVFLKKLSSLHVSMCDKVAASEKSLLQIGPHSLLIALRITVNSLE